MPSKIVAAQFQRTRSAESPSERRAPEETRPRGSRRPPRPVPGRRRTRRRPHARAGPDGGRRRGHLRRDHAPVVDQIPQAPGRRRPGPIPIAVSPSSPRDRARATIAGPSAASGSWPDVHRQLHTRPGLGRSGSMRGSRPSSSTTSSASAPSGPPRSVPSGLGVIAHLDGYFGALGEVVVATTSFDTTRGGVLLDPGARGGLQVSKDSWLTLQYETYVYVYPSVKLGGLVPSPGGRLRRVRAGPSSSTPPTSRPASSITA